MSTVTQTIRDFVPEFRPVVETVAPARQVRREPYPERAPGVGYGNSSGYATQRRYARGWDGQPRFRCG
ncbi:MAG TPA: hypothetical protein VFK18_01370 [Luteimonas sp.]|nr:hypothetical protein [Luteimonas sp.]